MSRERTEIAVITVDGYVFFETVNELRKRGIPFLALKPGESIPLGIKAVITSKAESRRIKHDRIMIYDKKGAKWTVNKVLTTLRDIQGCNHLIFGVDVGKTSGLAVVGDGNVVQTGIYNNAREIVDAIRENIRHWKPKEVTVKLGKGGLRKRSQIHDGGYYDGTEVIKQEIFGELGNRVRILLVDERNTTTIAKRLKVKRKERDETSAVEIALR
ncbi:MAG: hypothetical protein ABIH76_09035 [Candidatus Bathyarchaeota archaeon]